MTLGDIIGSVFLVACLAALWIGIPAYVIRRLWRSRKNARLPLEPLKPGERRDTMRGPKEINLDPTEYSAPTRGKEPLFAPGGKRFVLMFVVALVIGTALSYPLGALHSYLVKNYPVVPR